MKQKSHEGFSVIGLSARVRNDKPSEISDLWTQFHQSDLRKQLPDAISAEVHCVYHAYAGDHSDPFDMTIGYPVPHGTTCPYGLHYVEIPPQTVAVFDATGAQPDTVTSQWQAIWQSDLDRSFVADFDVYDAAKPDHVTVNVGLKAK